MRFVVGINSGFSKDFFVNTDVEFANIDVKYIDELLKHCDKMMANYKTFSAFSNTLSKMGALFNITMSTRPDALFTTVLFYALMANYRMMLRSSYYILSTNGVVKQGALTQFSAVKMIARKLAGELKKTV